MVDNRSFDDKLIKRKWFLYQKYVSRNKYNKKIKAHNQI